jgi:alpha-D-xyloside xylohydrolase
MVDELATMGIETMVTFWPFQSKESRYFANFSANGWLVNTLEGKEASYDGGDQFLVDETSPVVRAAVFEAFWEGYGRYGIKSIWIDAAEPEHFGSEAEGTWRYSLGSDAEVGEAFIQQHARTFQEGFASKGIAPGDYFILPRHAWAGSWRYSAALWSGDIQSSFEELALQVKNAQQVGLSGVALWTTDIGGESALCLAAALGLGRGCLVHLSLSPLLSPPALSPLSLQAILEETQPAQSFRSLSFAG